MRKVFNFLILWLFFVPNTFFLVKPIRWKTRKIPVVIFLNSNRYRSDIDSLIKLDQFNFFEFRPKGLNLLNLIFDPKGDVRSNKFVSIPRTMRFRCLASILKVFSEFFVIRIVSCSFYYGQDALLEAISEVSGIKFICLYKEFIKDDAVKADTIGRFKKQKYRFRGALLMCANDTIRDIVVEAGVCKQSQTAVVGSPRFDDLLSNRTKVSASKHIVLFSFHHASGLIQLKNSRFFCEEGEGFADLFFLVHKEFLRSCVKFQDVKFTIKLKWGGEWFDRIKEIQRNEFPGEIFQNLEISICKPAQDLINDASTVVAFNSTTIFEAMAVGIWPIVPMYSADIKRNFDRHVYFHKILKNLDVCHSERSFRSKLEAACTGTRINDFEKSSAALSLFAESYLGGYVAPRLSRDEIGRLMK